VFELEVQTLDKTMPNISYKTVAYYLRLSLEHLNSLPEPEDREYGEVEDFDALIYEPTKPEDADDDSLLRVIPYQVPEPINWLSFLDRLHQVDFLRSDLSWTIMSKRMLYVLRSVGDFPHKAIPMRIFDYSLKDKVDNYLRKEYYPSEVCNQDYVVLQLLEATDAIDTELSEYGEPGLILPPKITRLILREPAGGFPPIFRLAKKLSVYIYVSPQAKQALEDAGIRGLQYFEEEGVRAEGATVS
jgi:hypothetical protein